MTGRSILKIAFIASLAVGIGTIVACSSDHAANGTIGGNGNDPTACNTEGAEQTCRINLGVKNGVESCATGIATCTAGHWGPCQASGATKTGTFGGVKTTKKSSGINLSSGSDSNGSGGGLHILADPVDASAGANLCKSGTGDPCDPYCWAWDDEAGAVAPPPACLTLKSGNYPTIQGGAKINSTTCSTTIGTGENDCSYDQCCAVAGSNCVPFGSATTGRCVQPPAGDTFGDVGQTGGGNCAAGVDFTAEVACDLTPAKDTVLTICNRGGATAISTLNVGIKGGGADTYPFNATFGCAIDFATAGTLAPNACGLLNFGQGTWNGATTGVDCSSIAATVPARVTAIAGLGDTEILLNTNATWDATTAAMTGTAECNSANNWSAGHHQICSNIGPSCGGTGDTGDLPGGWYNSATNSPCRSPGNLGDCSFDQCCPTNGGSCQDWATAPVTGNCDPATNCAGKADFTMEVGCNDTATGHLNLTVCNRGTITADNTLGDGKLPVSISINFPPGIYPFLAQDGHCKIDLNMHPLAPNACFEFDAISPPPGVTCNSMTPGSANRGFVNGGSSNGASYNSGDIHLPECSSGNNWSGTNNQSCSTSGAAGATVFTCGSYSSLTAGPDKTNPGMCHTNGPGKSDCQYGSCCWGQNKQCVPYDQNVSGYCDPNTICGGAVDFTANVACVDTNSDIHVQVCNHGGNDETGSGTFYVSFGNVNSNPKQPLNPAAANCNWDWGTLGPLTADQCMDLNVSQATLDGNTVDCNAVGLTTALRNTFMSLGRRTIFVNGQPNSNPPGTINAAFPECNSVNNWSEYEPGLGCNACPVAPPTAGPTSYDYTGKCDPGFHVKWKYFLFDVTGGDVTFQASTDFTEIDGSVAPTSTPVTIANPPIAPATTACHYNSPAGVCPIDIGTILGNDAYGQVLHLDIIPGSGIPLKWSISYDCLPYE